MDMDLVVIFTFVSMVVLIITAGVVLLPITRKLGVYLEEAAIERRNARLSGAPAGAEAPRLQAAPTGLLEVLGRLEDQIASVADRQAFVERLLEERPVGERGPSEISE